MRNLIGDKNSFGIEYEIQSVDYYESGKPYVMGHMRLWLEGKYIGAIEDVDMIDAAWWVLEGGGRRKECQFSNMVAGEIYELKITDGLSGVYSCQPGPSFDDFVILQYVCNGKIYFIWKLEDKPFSQYQDYPRDVQSAVVSVEEYRRVVAELGEIIETIYKQEEREGRYAPDIQALDNREKRGDDLIIIRRIRIGKKIAIIIGSRPRFIITIDDKAIGSRALLFILLLILLLLGLFYHMWV